MESQQPARSRAVLVGLVILVGLWGPLSPAFAGPADARIVLDSDRFVVGSKWTVDILVDAADPLSVRFPAPTLPANLSLVDGPYIRETSWEKVPGTLSRATKVSLTLKTLAPGIVDLGPFELKVGSTVRSVPAVTVYLLAADEAKRRFPVELRWVKPEGPFYEGQAIPLLLQARNLDTLAQAQDLSLAAPVGALWEKAAGLGEIEINSVGEDRLMNLPWGGWMLIPTKAGSLTIPSVKAPVAGLDRIVPPLVLDVQALPPEAGTSRAVGDFTYTIDAAEGTEAQAGRLVVTQELSGRGNFPYLELPPVAAPPGLTLVSRQEGNRYRVVKNGYEGSLVLTWQFSSDKARPVAVTLPGFQAFQPGTGRVDTWDPRTLVVDLARSPAAGPAVVAEKPLDWQGILAVRPWGFTQDGWAFLFFLPGPLFLASTFLLPGRRRGLFILTSATLVFLSALPAPPAGVVEAFAAHGTQAADRWGALAAAHPDEPGFWYNKALACRDTNRTAEAVHAFRMALLTGFQGDQAARGLVALEDKELLIDQFQPWTGVPMNYLFLALALGVNLTFVFWGLQRIFGVGAWLPPLAVVVLITAGIGIVQISAETARLEPDAVVGLADGPIRKVPGDLSEAWMTLKAGTVVKVEGKSEGWVLVRTGYGLEGWVKGPSLLPLKGGI